MKLGTPDGQKWKREVSRGILIASIPFDVKELVLVDILPRKGLASADHHLRNIEIRWSDQGKRNWIVLDIGLNRTPQQIRNCDCQ
jgi:hypothetical protein